MGREMVCGVEAADRESQETICAACIFGATEPVAEPSSHNGGRHLVAP